MSTETQIELLEKAAKVADEKIKRLQTFKINADMTTALHKAEKAKKGENEIMRNSYYKKQNPSKKHRPICASGAVFLMLISLLFASVGFGAGFAVTQEGISRSLRNGTDYLPVWYGTARNERAICEKRPTYIESADYIADWTGADELDTDNYLYSTVSGGGSIKMTKATGGTCDASITADGSGGNWYGNIIDGCYVRIRFYLPALTQPLIEPLNDNAGMGLQFKIGKDASNCYRYSLGGTGDYTSGWNDLWVYINKPEYTSGTWDEATEGVTYIAFNAWDEPDGAYWILDCIEFYEGPFLEKPIVCVTLDDGESDQKQMAAYAISKGVPVTLFVHSDLVGSDSAFYLSLEELKELGRTGLVLIANHTANNEVPATLSAGDDVITIPQAKTNIYDCAEFLQKNGFIQGAGFVSFPQGEIRWRTIGFEARYDMENIITSFRDIGGYTIDTAIPNAVANCFNRQVIKTSGSPLYMGAQADFATCDLYVEVKAAKSILVTYGHNLSEGVSWAEWTDFIDDVAVDVAAGTVRAVLYDELMTIK